VDKMGYSLLHRKERLILTTIELIDEIGIQKLTTREIAKREGVSEATIFRHYASKNELLISVLDYFTQYDADLLQTAKMRELKPLDALKFIINSYAEYYENYPAITSILQIFDVLRYEADLSEKILVIQQERTAILTQLIEAAVKDGKLKNTTKPQVLAVMLSGFFRELCFNWRLNQCTYSLRDKTQEVFELIEEGFLNN
jgi:AcrR family transcriptional regulator